MRIFSKNGLWIQSGKQSIGIDLRNGKKKAECSLISHAHSDHYGGKHENAWATAETIALIQNSKPSFNHCKAVPFEKKQVIGETKASFHNAGHVLGSGQIALETEGKKMVITSDFNPVDSILFKGAKPTECDWLVMETTFGMPEYSFPERETVHQQIGKWIKENAKQNRFTVLAGYSLGKAQELTRICNDYANETPLVHEKIFLHNQTYEKFGVQLGKFLKLDHNLKESNVLILPPTLLDKNIVPALEYSLGKKVVTAMATGWRYRNGFDKTFPLSDHADYSHLLEFVQECQPKQVYTMHGFAKEFAATVQRKLRIPARALGEKSQSSLAEFEFA
jgi:Cft2 family RNA processing exonuclease